MVVDLSLDMRNCRDGISKLARNQEGFRQTTLARPLLKVRTAVRSRRKEMNEVIHQP